MDISLKSVCLKYLQWKINIFLLDKQTQVITFESDYNIYTEIF